MPARAYEERRGARSEGLDGLRSEKRDRFLVEDPAKKRNKALRFIGIPLAVFVVLGVGFYFLAGDSVGIKSGVGQRRSSGIFTTVTPEAGLVKLAAADFQDGKARFYTYKSPAGKEIDFFVLKSSDGIVRAAIDSCDVCYTYRKGYHQEGDEMVCNNCGQRFPSVKINVIKGGCNPAPLTRETVDGTVLISEKDIVTDGDYYF